MVCQGLLLSTQWKLCECHFRLPEDYQYKSVSHLAYYNTGYIYFSQNNWPLAIRHFEMSAKVNPEFEKPVYMLGLTKEAMGKNEEAIGFYKKTLQINPNFELAKEGLKRLKTT